MLFGKQGYDLRCLGIIKRAYAQGLVFFQHNYLATENKEEIKYKEGDSFI
jgi:hypothetical protein